MFRNQLGFCNNPYCRADLKVTPYEIDHIVAKSRGGPRSRWLPRRRALTLRVLELSLLGLPLAFILDRDEPPSPPP
jgi:hypothetical protein